MKKILFLVIALLCFAVPSFAVDVYCGAAVTGDGSGDSWINQCDFDTKTLVRGYTYYLADGNYASKTFNTIESGETYIYIKKATATSHGTETGWSASYGDGQAVFGTQTFSTGYYIFDGVTGGGPSSWDSGYGFLISVSAGANNGVVIGAVNNITISHTDITAPSRDTENGTGIYAISGGANHVYQYCRIKNFDVLIREHNTTGNIVEYCKLGPTVKDDLPAHTIGYSAEAGTNNIIRYNLFEDISDTAYIGIVNAYGSAMCDNWSIYGNVFWETGTLERVLNTRLVSFGYTQEAPNTLTVRNLKFYNNTIVNLGVDYPVSILGVYMSDNVIDGGGNIAYNNLFYKNIAATMVLRNCSHQYNYYSGNVNSVGASINLTETNGQITSVDPFVSWATGNFALSAATNPASTLASPYNTDMFGSTRGSDGNWDRGAVERDEVSIYVKDGGTGSGTSWTDALDQLPTSLIRGKTYYVADGVYNGRTISAALSGTSEIKIIKCGTGDGTCESAAGYISSDHDGQAVFTPFTIQASSGYSGYITIDGSYEYGIKINVPAPTGSTSTHGIYIYTGGVNLTFKNIEIAGAGGESETRFNWCSGVDPCGGSRGITHTGALPGTTPSSNMLISHVKIYGVDTALYIYRFADSTIEYCDFGHLYSANDAVHTNIMYIGGNTDRITIRYNKFHHFDTEGIFFTNSGGTLWTDSGIDDIYIYGNVFYDGYPGTYSRGIETRTEYYYGDIYVYNNTFSNLYWGVSEHIEAHNKYYIYNNLFYNMTSTSIIVRTATGYEDVVDYNWFYLASTSGSNTQVGTSDPFVSSSTDDYRLFAATNPGYTLSSPYNYDMNGVLRGSDSIWDRGAFEQTTVTSKNWYVRKGATGSNNGSDWTNAWNEMNQISWSSISPGDTIWLSGGTYTSGITVGRSGTSGSRIYVKRVKSTDAAPIAAVGWNAAYDADVLINSNFGIQWPTTPCNRTGSFVTIDGQQDAGIKVRFPDGAIGSLNYGVYINNGPENVVLRYIDSGGSSSPDNAQYNYNGTNRAFAILSGSCVSPLEGTIAKDITISRCRAHNVVDGIFLARVNGAVIEYNKVYNVLHTGTTKTIPPCDGTDACLDTMHTNTMGLQTCYGTVTWRYNEMYNGSAEGIIMGAMSGNVPCSQELYGNLMHSPFPGVDNWRFAEFQYANWPAKIYNNTIVDLPGYMVRTLLGATLAAGSEIRNNLWVKSGSMLIDGTYTASNNLSTSDTTYFTNYSGDNYTLAKETIPGYPTTGILPGNTIDMLGSTRGLDTNWDVGAYEKTGSIYYIRPGATGSNNGADWTNAYTTLPSTLLRGATYYLADGNYGSYTFNDIVDGTNYIYIKKATVTDHGTSTGWNDSYGNEQAVFSQMTFTTSYWEIDGQVGGGPTSWTSGHGIKVNYTGIHYGITIGYGTSYIALRHVEVAGLGRDTTTGNCQRAIYGSVSSNITISYCWLHDVGKGIVQLDHSDNKLIEYSKLGPTGIDVTETNYGVTDCHSFGVGIRNGDNFIFRYNLMEDITETGYFTSLEYEDGETINGWYVYGNIFQQSDFRTQNSTNYVFYINSSLVMFSNVKIYNNTFLGFTGSQPWSFTAKQEGTNEIKNNIFYDNVWVSINAPFSSSYNYYQYNRNSSGTDINRSESNGQTSLSSTSPFVSSTNYNFSLLNATNAGATFASPYDKDMLGNTRGSDNNWDRGAIEKTGADTLPPTFPLSTPSGEQSCPEGSNPLAVTYGVDTNEPATCSWGELSITPYADMTDFESGYGMVHRSTDDFACGAGETPASYTRYVKCVDAVGNTNTTTYGTISFSIAPEGIGGDVTPPTMSNPIPTTGTRYPCTTPPTISVNLGISAIDESGVTGCGYSLTGPTVEYDSMTALSTTGGTPIQKVADYYSETNYSIGLTFFATAATKGGQSFYNATAGTLDTVKFYMSKTENPAGTVTGNATAKVYAHCAIGVGCEYGVSSLTDGGAALATSDPINVATGLSTVMGLKTFTFSGANRITLSADTYYVVLLEWEMVGSSSTNKLNLARDSTTPTHAGIAVTYYQGAWSSDTNRDVPFYVNTLSGGSGDYSKTVDFVCGATYTAYYRCTDGTNPNTSSSSTTFKVGSAKPDNAIEAESGTEVSPMVEYSDDQASGGKYIATTTPDAGSTTLTIADVPAGIYRIGAQVYGYAGSSSFGLTVNSEDKIYWYFNPTQSADYENVWFNDYVNSQGTATPPQVQTDPYLVELDGTSTFKFDGRGPGARLDYIWLELNGPINPDVPSAGTTFRLIGLGNSVVIGSGNTFIID